jgi:hypothetical protein
MFIVYNARNHAPYSFNLIVTVLYPLKVLLRTTTPRLAHTVKAAFAFKDFLLKSIMKNNQDAYTHLFSQVDILIFKASSFKSGVN